MKAFDCKQCGKCCYGEGGIHVNKKERERIARFLDMSPESFVTKYCEERNGRVYITTGSDNFCVFFNKEKQCLIHPVKPGTCSQWPFYPANVTDEDTWEGAKDACPGFNPDCSFSEFKKQAKKEKSKKSEVSPSTSSGSGEPEDRIKNQGVRSQKSGVRMNRQSR